MDGERGVWSERFRVRAYELDTRGRASIVTLANWLQEIAGNHATSLGWSVDQLFKRGQTWVLSRLHLRVARQPEWRDEVHLETWPAGVQRLFAFREFRLADGAGTELAVATSAWLLLDLASRRPVRPPDEIADLARSMPPRLLDDPFAKLPEVTRVDAETNLVVRLSDLDINRHANNVSVIAWALEALPEHAVGDSSLAELEVEFRAESHRGDRIVTQGQPDATEPAVFLHRVARADDGRELARARSRWRSEQR